MNIEKILLDCGFTRDRSNRPKMNFSFFKFVIDDKTIYVELYYFDFHWNGIIGNYKLGQYSSFERMIEAGLESVAFMNSRKLEDLFKEIQCKCIESNKQETEGKEE